MFLKSILEIPTSIFIVCDSFPGGIVEDGDGSLIDTALRETNEELGLEPDLFTVWGCLPAMPDRVTIHSSNIMCPLHNV